jgi:hypothetical protein
MTTSRFGFAFFRSGEPLRAAAIGTASLPPVIAGDDHHLWVA